MTRGRFENQLHIVAEDDDDARAKLVAALERDRADRGLDVARARAEVYSLPVPDVRVRRSAEHRRISIDPTSWRSAAELDRAERAIDAKLAHELRLHRVPPLLSDEQRARKNRIDRAAAEAARREAARHRSEAAGLESGRDELAIQAAADYLAARDDARVIVAGPGLLHQRASRLAAASAPRSEIAQRWREPRLPDAASVDDAVVRRARDAVARMIDPPIRQHLTEADRGEKHAAAIEAEMAWRERSYERAVRFAREVADYRQELIAKEPMIGQRSRTRGRRGRSPLPRFHRRRLPSLMAPVTPWLIVPSLRDRPHASAPTSAPSPSGSTWRTLSGAARSSGCDSARFIRAVLQRDGGISRGSQKDARASQRAATQRGDVRAGTARDRRLGAGRCPGPRALERRTTDRSVRTPPQWHAEEMRTSFSTASTGAESRCLSPAQRMKTKFGFTERSSLCQLALWKRKSGIPVRNSRGSFGSLRTLGEDSTT
jgi:hypothetical protein